MIRETAVRLYGVPWMIPERLALNRSNCLDMHEGRRVPSSPYPATNRVNYRLWIMQGFFVLPRCHNLG